MIFAEERFGDVAVEMYPLWLSHWQETEMYRRGERFNPDLTRYIQLNDADVYHLYTARVDGVLAGHAGMYVLSSMHTQIVEAREDTWFLLSEHRKGRNAIRFLDYVEAECRKHGAVRIGMDAKTVNKSGRIMELRGYSHIANRYSKEL